jgi:hypothetical protein
MANRRLRIVKKTPVLMGVCERCAAKFTEPTMAGIRAAFDAHTCAPLDPSQNAVRIVREATENK